MDHNEFQKCIKFPPPPLAMNLEIRSQIEQILYSQSNHLDEKFALAR